MTGPTSTMINLTFGNASVQVLSTPEGGLEALAAEVEAKFGLHPESFSIFDDFGKVEDSMALQRALDMAGDNPCILEVCEAPQWKKIREMDTKIKMLVARCPVVDRILMDIEEQSTKRFGKLASALQAVDERARLRGELVGAELRESLEELDAKVSNSIAPLLQCVALQEMDLKAKLDSLDASLFSEELDKKVTSGIAPMLQSMALQQMDLKVKLDSLQESPSRCTCEQLADSLEDTRKEVSNLQAYATKVEEVKEVTKDLQKELGVRSNSLQEAHEQLKALQVEVQNLTEQPTAGAGWGQILSAARQDLGKSPPMFAKNGLGGAGCHGEDFSQWIEGSTADMFSPIAYSKKSMNYGGAAVPFARFAAPRQLNQMQGSRSLPHLPPVR